MRKTFFMQNNKIVWKVDKPLQVWERETIFFFVLNNKKISFPWNWENDDDDTGGGSGSEERERERKSRKNSCRWDNKNNDDDDDDTTTTTATTTDTATSITANNNNYDKQTNKQVSRLFVKLIFIWSFCGGEGGGKGKTHKNYSNTYAILT